MQGGGDSGSSSSNSVMETAPVGQRSTGGGSAAGASNGSGANAARTGWGGASAAEKNKPTADAGPQQIEQKDKAAKKGDPMEESSLKSFSSSVRCA